MNAYIEAQRKTDPDFVFAKDGVHANEAGHALMADQVIAGLAPGDVAWWKKLRADLAANPKGAELKKLIHQHGRVLCDAYLNEAGHLRPGMAKGLPVAEAEAKAGELETKIKALVAEIAPGKP